MAFSTVIKERYLTNVPGELMGGLMAAIVALPAALAFGEASGLGAQAGLYGAIACGFFAALLGGTGGQVTGPTGPMTVVTAGLLASHADNIHLVFFAILLAGILQVVMGLLRLGEYIYYIPHAVVSGFMSGIGIIIICIQINPLLGVPGHGSVMETFKGLPVALAGLNAYAILCGILTLVIIYGLPRFTRVVPSSLVALVVMTIAVMLMGWDIPKIGVLPQGLPHLSLLLPEVAEAGIVLKVALTLALLGALDSLMTSIIVDRMTNKRHDSNLELIGQGAGNAISGMLGGLPSAGATMRSVINIQSGGKLYLSGMVHALLLLAVLLGLGSVVQHIPLACLAGILISVGISIIDYPGLQAIPTAPRHESVVLLAVLVLTVFSDLIIAVAAGILMTCLVFRQRLADSRIADSEVYSDIP